jgi:ubiquinol-cytochrome c reductase cytochrome b subunit
MKAVVSWFCERTGLGAGPRAERGPGPRQEAAAGRRRGLEVWPAAILFAFGVQAVTGFFLWCYYSPSRQTAWESVYFLQTHVAAGSLLRAIHHYTAHVLLGLLVIYVLQSVLTGACRAPRELVFWATVGMGLMALAAFLTGDLLPFDQQGYYASKTRTGFLTLLPWVGQGLLKLAIGGPGPDLGSLAVTRFFALHAGLFSGGFLLLLIARDVLARRADGLVNRGLTPTVGRPGRAWCGAVVCLAVMAVVLWLAIREHGAPLLSPADPAETYGAARPEWFLVGVYEFSHWFSGEWAIIPIFVVPGLVLCVLLAMPFLAARPLGWAFNAAFAVAVLVAIVCLSYRSLRADRADKKYREAVAAEDRQTDRVFALAEHEGIPPLGALTLLRNDAKTQGPRLFGQQCATCHPHSVSQADGTRNVPATAPSAPDLANFASREWLAGLLDPKQIIGPRYFGNTKLRRGKMPQFVKETLGDLDAAEKAELKKVIMALSAEAKLPAQAELDKQQAKEIEEGRTLLTDPQGAFGCTNCHSFRGKGALGSAPLLTGYGSADWMASMIRDPTDKQYYGSLNDRMPAFAPSPNADSPRNTLSLHQIRLLTDWLRGDWWEPQGDRNEH